MSKLKRKYRIRGLTPLQQEWLQNYQEQTMLEPVGLAEMAADPSTFDEWAKWNIGHFEDFSTDALRDISRNVPYNNEEHRYRKSPREVPECRSTTPYGCRRSAEPARTT